LISLCIEDLKAGMDASYEREVTEADIIAFAAVSGDINPMHLDEAYAAATDFKGRIAHGMLTASYISTVIGTQLPGPGAIYLSQTLRFMAPVRIGDVVRAVVRVIHLDPRRRRARLACFCYVGPNVVLEGEANVKVPSRG
jgi:3-hydroxybutyryl-CoA dehydratase